VIFSGLPMVPAGKNLELDLAAGQRVGLLGKTLREVFEVRAAGPGCRGADVLLGAGCASRQNERRRRRTGDAKMQLLHLFLPDCDGVCREFLAHGS